MAQNHLKTKKTGTNSNSNIVGENRLRTIAIRVEMICVEKKHFKFKVKRQVSRVVKIKITSWHRISLYV